MLSINKQKYTFETDCVNAIGEDIQDMLDKTRQITYKTFIKYVNYKILNEMFYWYHVKNDFHVGFYKSIYKGKKCYYLTHSAIEYIFIKH